MCFVSESRNGFSQEVHEPDGDREEGDSARLVGGCQSCGDISQQCSHP